MKSTIVSMIIVLIVIMSVPMFLVNDGEFAEKFGFGGAKEKNTMIETLQEQAPKNIQEVVTDKEVEVYKWVDQNGVTQFGQAPPMEGGDSKKIVLSPKTNVIDAFKAPESEVEVAKKPKVFKVGSPYSVEGMKQLVDDSVNVQELLNQRQAEQDQMMQDIFGKKK